MRILVVEDEPTVAAALERGLAAEGYDVDLASNGDDGLWMGLEHVYAVIVIDLMLPGRNGYQVCRELRSSGVSTPILILTAKGGEYDEAEGLDAGADDYMTKPFSLVVLSARLRALLRRRPVLAHRVQVVADLEIDFDGRRCHRAGTAIDLTHREFALLETLARDPGTVRSKP